MSLGEKKGDLITPVVLFFVKRGTHLAQLQDFLACSSTYSMNSYLRNKRWIKSMNKIADELIMFFPLSLKIS